jgi:hypothetical protein
VAAGSNGAFKVARAADADQIIEGFKVGTSSANFVVRADGRTGIGTDSPDGSLQVGVLDSPGSLRAGLVVKTISTTQNNSESAIYIEESSGGEGYYLRVDSTGGLAFDNSAATTPTLYLSDSDYVGIGTDSPAGLLHISGNTCQLHFTDEDDSASTRIYQSGATFGIDVDHADAKSGSVFVIRVDDAEHMKISSTGRVNVPEVYNTQIGATNRDLHVENTGQLGYVSSTRKSKGNITLLNNVNWLYQLQPSSFNYKVRDEDGELTDTLSAELEYGLIAEDVESVAPELCFYDEVDGQQELRGIHYKKLIVPLLKALQDANTKIETLETKVATLEGS